MPRRGKSLAAIGFLLLLAVAAGCRSGKHSLVDARQAFAAGDLESAGTALRTLAETGPKRNRHASELDLAVVELAAGDADSAESRLRRLRDHFDALPTTPGVHDAVSLATDDNVRPFEIAGYEQVLLRTLLAICSLAGDGTDAESYCLQAQSRQAELMRSHGGDTESSDLQSSDVDVPPRQQVALAPYLRGTLREATHDNYDDAERAFRLVGRMMPDFAPATADIRRVSEGSHSRSGHGVVYVLALVGRGPRLVETVAPTTTTSLQIASTLLRSAEKQSDGDSDTPVLPNIASVKVPVVEIPPSRIAAVGVAFRGELLGATQTITDVGRLAIERSEAEMPWTLARAIARRVLKESSVAATSKSLGLTGDAAAAFEFAAINAWSASERADTRCWGLLPREIQVLRAELPVGPQTIEVVPMAAGGIFDAKPHAYPLRIEDGRNHYIVVVAPEAIVSVVPEPPRGQDHTRTPIPDRSL